MKFVPGRKDDVFGLYGTDEAFRTSIVGAVVLGFMAVTPFLDKGGRGRAQIELLSKRNWIVCSKTDLSRSVFRLNGLPNLVHQTVAAFGIPAMAIAGVQYCVNLIVIEDSD